MNTAALSANDGEIARVLPRGRHTLDPEVVRTSQRERLLDAATKVIATKGYPAVTIDDIVRRAGTARRSFYANFDSKEDCALAAFSRVADGLMSAIVARFDPATPDQAARAKVVVDAILNFHVDNPVFAWIYFVGVNTVSPAGVARASEVRRHMAEMLVRLRRNVRRSQPEIPELSQEHAFALVGALHEILAQAMHERGPERLGELSDTLVPLMVALLEVNVDPGGGP